MSNVNLQEAMSNYDRISHFIKSYSKQEIVQLIANLCRVEPERLLSWPMGGYSKGKSSGAYNLVLDDLQKNITHYDWVYEHLCDDISRKVFANLIRYRIIPDNQFIKAAFDPRYPEYFDDEVIHFDENEVFADCGGFHGETTELFIQKYQSYKHIYVYEPEPENAEICRQNLHRYPNVIVRNCGIGEQSSEIQIFRDGSASSFMDNSTDGEAAQSVSLDEDIQEKLTFIKMDIEGFEIPALLGAKKHITQGKPKLAICLYHVISDIWEIPRLIHQMNPDYQLYIRHYDADQNWETVLYAIPKQEIQPTLSPKRKKTIVSISSEPNGAWFDAQFLKDCGVIPYLLHKNHDCDVTLVGVKPDAPYTNDKYIPGVKIDCCLPDASPASKNRYILEYARDIDCLVLYGCYDDKYSDVAFLYKQLNPQGKVYLSLDANSAWMDRIQWDSPSYLRLMNNCDVIGASDRQMQSLLNEKWPWRIEYFPNGFYDFANGAVPRTLDEKENIILSVSRLGSPQKATAVLLEAFARIAEKVPNWKLKLVGTIEPAFQSFIDEYFIRFPELKSQVEFAGPIYDRLELYKTYKKAKIFALSSKWEGGAPNVIGEALNHGCATAVTKIDAYRDIIFDGRCGLASEIGDIDGFAGNLLHLCTDPTLPEKCQTALEIGQTIYNSERMVAKLYRMLFESNDVF